MVKQELRTRNYATVVYPESAQKNWISILEELCVPALISPIHDKDINTDGTLKKEHFHVMIMFDGVKTQEQAKEVFEQIGGVGVEVVRSIRAYARYLCHLDNEDKPRYSMEDVICCSGADFYSLITMPKDKYSTIGEILDFCMENHVVSYAELLLYAKNNRYNDWFPVLCDSATVTIVQFLKSRYWEWKKQNEGELI